MPDAFSSEGKDAAISGQVSRRAQDSSTLVYQGRVFSVRRHEALEPGGVRVVRDVVHHRGSAVILPVLPNGRVVLIRQYRLAAGKHLWELPAGTRDAGETPLQTARRELEEETGYRARRMRKLMAYYPSPGIISERMHLFLADQMRPGRARPEADERIQVRAFSRAELARMIRAGRIVDANSLVALLYWMRWGGR